MGQRSGGRRWLQPLGVLVAIGGAIFVMSAYVTFVAGVDRDERQCLEIRDGEGLARESFQPGDSLVLKGGSPEAPCTDPGAEVVAYLGDDGMRIGRVHADLDGVYDTTGLRMTVPDVESGEYSLRVETSLGGEDVTYRAALQVGRQAGSLLSRSELMMVYVWFGLLAIGGLVLLIYTWSRRRQYGAGTSPWSFDIPPDPKRGPDHPRWSREPPRPGEGSGLPGWDAPAGDWSGWEPTDSGDLDRGGERNGWDPTDLDRRRPGSPEWDPDQRDE